MDGIGVKLKHLGFFFFPFFFCLPYLQLDLLFVLFVIQFYLSA